MSSLLLCESAHQWVSQCHSNLGGLWVKCLVFWRKSAHFQGFAKENFNTLESLKLRIMMRQSDLMMQWLIWWEMSESAHLNKQIHQNFALKIAKVNSTFRALLQHMWSRVLDFLVPEADGYRLMSSWCAKSQVFIQLECYFEWLKSDLWDWIIIF